MVLLVHLSRKHESELFESEFLSARVLDLSLSIQSLVVRIFELLYDRLVHYYVQGPIINLALNHTGLNYL